MNDIKAKLPPRQPHQPTKINIQEITQEPQMTNKKVKTEDIKPLYEKRILCKLRLLCFAIKHRLSIFVLGKYK